MIKTYNEFENAMIDWNGYPSDRLVELPTGERLWTVEEFIFAVKMDPDMMEFIKTQRTEYVKEMMADAGGSAK